MEHFLERDYITIEDEDGNNKEFSVEGIIYQGEKTYALLKGDTETVLMKVEDEGDEQYLVGIEDEEEVDSILSAYEIAVEGTSELE
ncbi:DUF1292 domain-containing protein [Robertmurraya sp. P23]|uniref:DUF1292 domain-containing protein n=1 Tax=Robertmurraya sp. P23 TaxID=3436931 RepID=UPI003D95DB7A